MKQLLTILIALSIGLSCIGTAAVLLYQREQVREEVKMLLLNELPEDALVRFEFTREELMHVVRWHDDREFSFRGEMYDVVCREETPEMVILLCWHDIPETDLNARIRALAMSGEKTPASEQGALSLQHFLKSLCGPAEAACDTEMMMPRALRDHGFDRVPLTRTKGPPTPPPDYV